MGRLLIVIGFALVFLGALLLLGERAGLRFGRLPGDIVYRGRNTAFYFPITTCVLLSALLTLISWLLGRR